MGVFSLHGVGVPRLTPIKPTLATIGQTVTKAPTTVFDKKIITNQYT